MSRSGILARVSAKSNLYVPIGNILIPRESGRRFDTDCPATGDADKQRHRSIKVLSLIFDVRTRWRHTPMRRQVLGLIYETQPSSHHRRKWDCLTGDLCISESVSSRKLSHASSHASTISSVCSSRFSRHYAIFCTSLDKVVL